ncbi:MAG: acyl-CoA dehydrogenase, partial [Acidimicrobiia bacterium]|nr:acyl-CoA dehydrogenase [Acidimicrobiia bacterium]
MDFAYSARCDELRDKLHSFMDDYVYPAEDAHFAELASSGDPAALTDVLANLKVKAKAVGLWNLFLPDDEWGVGLSNADYAPLAEIMGRSVWLAPEATNCAAPDTGNMEVLTNFGTPQQQQRWLVPLLEGDIRSCFGMTEPAVASSDPRNLEARIERDGDEYVINGTKWWSSGAMTASICIFMGVTNPDADPKGRYSMILVPMDAPGVSIVRDLPVFGY